MSFSEGNLFYAIWNVEAKKRLIFRLSVFLMKITQPVETFE